MRSIYTFIIFDKDTYWKDGATPDLLIQCGNAFVTIGKTIAGPFSESSLMLFFFQTGSLPLARAMYAEQINTPKYAEQINASHNWACLFSYILCGDPTTVGLLGLGGK